MPVFAGGMPRTDWRRVARRYVAAIVYWSIGHRLPWSPRPGGRIGKYVRGVLAAEMLDKCGEAVNVERGASFGSGKGIELGDRSDIGKDCLIIGPVTIGKDVMMGPRCTILASSHRTSNLKEPMNTQGYLPDRRILIEDDVWIGASCTILPGRRIGKGSIVGAGAVVVADVPPMAIVAGNPAVLKGYRSDPVR